VSARDARALWEEVRETHGLKGAPALLTPPEGNAKFAKTAVPTYGLALAPHKLSATVNVCRYATPECRAGCVAFAGHGEMPFVQRVRIARTEFLAQHPDAFVALLTGELERLVSNRKRYAVRLNTFSDLPWERIAPALFTLPRIQFYDYTKWPMDLRADRPANYHLTYSASERTTGAQVVDYVTGGQNVAVIFAVKRGQPLPTEYLGCRVIDGDKSDARYRDPVGVVVGLRAKGRMARGSWTMAN
jgi:hypothetical protein